MKTITDYADEYVGHPQEIDEDLSAYSSREAYKAGMNKAFGLIRSIVDDTFANKYVHWSIPIYGFLNKMQRKETEK